MKHFVATLIGMAALALTACGSDPTPGNGVAVVQVGGATGTELAERQILRLGNGAELQSLDPHRSEDVASSNVHRDLYEGLVNEAPNGELIPGAAASWTRSDDGKTYTFHLRPEARWSNGDRVTADDFVFALRRGADPKTGSVYSYILSPIENADAVTRGEQPPDELGVRALDDLTLEIRLANATPYFLGLLTHSMTYPVHRATLEAHGADWTRPGNLVGNGAFKLDEWVVQSHLKLVRNPNYWDNASNRLDEVWFYPTEDQTAELQRFRAGELDMTDTVPNSQLAFIRQNMADRLHIGTYLGSYYYGFNLTRPPFKDNPKLRRALSLAIDRDIITKQVLAAGQEPAYGFVPPVADYTPQQMPEAAWTQEQREVEAKRLYEEAGYSAQNPLRTEIMYNTQDDHRRIALAIAAMWKQVLGVQATITNQEWKVFIDTRNRKIDTQVYRQGWIGDYNDAFTFAELLRTQSGNNDTGYSSAEYDRLVTAAQSELDMGVRAALLEEAERVLLADMPVMPLYFYVRA